MKLRDLRHKICMNTPKVNLHYTNLEKRFEREIKRLKAEANQPKVIPIGRKRVAK